MRSWAHAWCGTWSRWSSARGSAFYWSPMIWKRHSPSRTKSICYRKGRARTSPSITRCRFRARAIPSIRARIPPLRRSTSGCGRTSRAKSIIGRRRHETSRPPLRLGAPARRLRGRAGGVALGIVVGIVLGVVAALVPFIAELLEPVMTVLNAIPRVILAPLFVIWLGIGLASKVALSFILVAVLIFFTVFTGIRQVDRRLVERVVTLGGDRWALVRHVYLPSVASWVLGNLKIAVGFAFTGACVGEFVAATEGLGYLLSFAQSTYNAALMFALILLILAVVLVIFGLAGRLEKHLLRWN